jgi:uncharacterized protein YdeI (BOF family)
MKKRVQSLWFLGALVILLSVGVSLNAQQGTAPPQTSNQQTDQAAPPPQAQQPAQQQTQPDQTPTSDPQAQTAAPADAQSFTGTIMKSGDKYLFKDAATGNTYDIDHQDEVQKFEGKTVKVHGTLDAANHIIHVK